MKGEADRTAALMSAILGSRGLTLHQVSAQSELLYGSGSPFYIPHTLYHSIENYRWFGPSLPQTCALSYITGYRLEDWLAVLGIDLDRVAGLEASLPVRRTRLIDTAFDRAGFIMGEADIQETGPPPGGVVPLGQLLGWVKQTSRSSGARRERRARFARIGTDDAFALPELLPGSIVRFVPATPPESDIDRLSRPRLLLIEHERGLWCGRFHVSPNKIVHAAASELSYAPIAFQIPGEARVLGTVDMEIRWMHRFESPHVPAEFATYQQPRSLDRTNPGLGTLIRRARAQAGLTLREASLLARRISLSLGDQQYAAAESTLSDYEAQDLPPRHLEKVITLCLIYGIGLMDFIAASGTRPELLGGEMIPGHLMRGSQNAVADSCQLQPSVHDAFGARLPLFSAFEEVPGFLRTVVAELSGIQRPSVRDFFLLSGQHPFLPAHTEGSLLALVNRRKKRPARLANQNPWQQPAYALLLRSGEYCCASCSVEQETLVLYPESDRSRAPEKLRLGRDVEIVGQIVALVRSIR
jgi:hypothetical protein